MAHFAEINQDNTVLRVVVINNNELKDADGVEQEGLGIGFCQSLFGGTWKQTSYNGNLRFNFAGVGYSYDSGRDAFIQPQPYKSWVLDEKTCKWTAPVAHPTDLLNYEWDEAKVAWVQIKPL